MLVAIDRNPLCACKSIFKSPAFNVRVRVQGASDGCLSGSPPACFKTTPDTKRVPMAKGKGARTRTRTKRTKPNDGEVKKQSSLVWDAEKDMQPIVCVSIRWGCVGWAPDISQDFWWVSPCRHLAQPRPRCSWPHLSGTRGLPKSRH